jgi:hypothetical protein
MGMDFKNFQDDIDKFTEYDIPHTFLRKTIDATLFMWERLVDYTPIDKSGKNKWGVRHAEKNWIITTGFETPMENGILSGNRGDEVSTAKPNPDDQEYRGKFTNDSAVRKGTKFYITNMATRRERNGAPHKYMADILAGSQDRPARNFLPIVMQETVNFIRMRQRSSDMTAAFKNRNK